MDKNIKNFDTQDTVGKLFSITPINKKKISNELVFPQKTVVIKRYTPDYEEYFSKKIAKSSNEIRFM